MKNSISRTKSVVYSLPLFIHFHLYIYLNCRSIKLDKIRGF